MSQSISFFWVLDIVGRLLSMETIFTASISVCRPLCIPASWLLYTCHAVTEVDPDIETLIHSWLTRHWSLLVVYMKNGTTCGQYNYCSVSRISLVGHGSNIVVLPWCYLQCTSTAVVTTAIYSPSLQLVLALTRSTTIPRYLYTWYIHFSWNICKYVLIENLMLLVFILYLG